MDNQETTPGFRYERYSGSEKHICLPSQENGRRLTCIGAKAFLSCKSIEQLKLPDTLEEVEDWAFAHTKNLRELWLPAKKLKLGKKVFLGCESLEKIGFTNREKGELYEGIPYFLGAVARFFPEDLAGVLLDELQAAGDAFRQWLWLEEYDKALTLFIKSPDEEGFEPAFIGWFDVEDVDDQKRDYIQKHREDKIFLAFQRLRYEEALSDETKAFLQQYLRERGEVLLGLFTNCENYKRDISYYKIWRAAGGLSYNQAKSLMERHSGQDGEADPEITGFLIECQLEESEKGKDFFEGLDL